MEGEVAQGRKCEYRGKAEKENMRVKMALGDNLDVISSERYVQTGGSKMKGSYKGHRPQEDPSPLTLGKFRGKWVAVLHGAVIASGDRAIEVLRRVDLEFPTEKPSVYRVPSDEVMLL